MALTVRLESNATRFGSGGDVRHRGGDGGDRRVRFLEPMTAVMLANHCREAPLGLDGGQAGATGRNWVERADGRREEFGATFKVDMGAGDIVVIQTPGGGGFGLDGRDGVIAVRMGGAGLRRRRLGERNRVLSCLVTWGNGYMIGMAVRDAAVSRPGQPAGEGLPSHKQRQKVVHLRTARPELAIQRNGVVYNCTTRC